MNTFRNSINMEFVQLPPGTFRMGMRGMANTEPIHQVSLSSFWIGRYEVTNEQFECFKKRPRPAESLLPNQPATRLTWKNANEFCTWLSSKEKRHYRLPTEAEWEYAARGGLDQMLYPWGNDKNWEGRATFGSVYATPVGSYKPNGYGLYDMAGNVWEYVSDFYDEHYYSRSPKNNPTGPRKPVAPFGSAFHILRGGFFSIYQGYCGLRDLSSDEVRTDPARFGDLSQSDGSGFRVAMTI